MRGKLDTVIYVATTPIRLFGRSRRFRIALGAACIAGVCFAATLWALDRFLPADSGVETAIATLQPPPPLQAVTRSSYVIAPVAVALAAIQRSMDAAAPRELAGKNDNPVSSLLSKADIGITIARGAMTVSGQPNELAISAPLNGTLRVTGQIAAQAGNLTSSITSLLDKSIGKDVGLLTGKVLDQPAELHGQVVVHSRPALSANWRLEPNLTAQVALSNSAVSLAGFNLDVSNEARPLIDREVNAQVANLESRLRSDPFIERSARVQWAKMCRSIPLGGDKTGLPRLWLEMRPMRAAAAQPQIDGHNVTLTVGVQADTRITDKATKPDCPFPAKLELVPPMDNGRLVVGVPIDVPFTELNKLMEAQFKGHRFPEDGTALYEIEVLSAQVAASGDRLLISLRVKAREKKSWFGFGAEATVQIWGKPALDAKDQMLRFTDLSVAVESKAALGLLGAAARAGIPYLQKALASKAVVDLKPFAADAKKKIAIALADFEKNSEGVRVDTAINDLRLTGIAFDATTLRVIAEAAGSARVNVTDLPRL
jgi:Domain of unknown function (DUF4403)